MTHEEILQAIQNDSELAEKINVSLFTPEKVTSFLETEEGKKVVQPKLDKYFSKGLDTWKQNNLQKLIDEAVANANPTETPEQKEIRELKERLDRAEHEKQLEALKLKAHAEANTLGLPVELVNYFVSDSEEGTKENLKSFSLQFQTAIEKAVEDKLKQSASTPPPTQSQQGQQGDLTKEDFLSMSYRERLELFNTNKDLYDSLTE